MEKKQGLGRDGQAVAGALYDLIEDPGETRNQSTSQSSVVAQHNLYAESARYELGDLNRPCANVRPDGSFAPATPRVLAKDGQ